MTKTPTKIQLELIRGFHNVPGVGVSVNPPFRYLTVGPHPYNQTYFYRDHVEFIIREHRNNKANVVVVKHWQDAGEIEGTRTCLKRSINRLCKHHIDMLNLEK